MKSKIEVAPHPAGGQRNPFLPPPGPLAGGRREKSSLAGLDGGAP